MQTTSHSHTTPPTAPSTTPPTTVHRPDPDRIASAIATRSFAMLATVSPAGYPHAAGVLYEQVGGHLYVSTLRGSRKARNVAANGRVGVCIPIRRIPFGPPASVQFQANADVLAIDDLEIRRLVSDGELASVTGHGELELADGCFLRIEIPSRLHTYGLGMSLKALMKNPLAGGGVVDAGETTGSS